MKNLLTVEGFFDKFKKSGKEPTPGEEYVKPDNIIEIEGNPYYAKPVDKSGNKWVVMAHLRKKVDKAMASLLEPHAYITKLEDGNFLLKWNKKNIKIPTIERGLDYMKEEDEGNKAKRDKIDIDLTND